MCPVCLFLRVSAYEQKGLKSLLFRNVPEEKELLNQVKIVEQITPARKFHNITSSPPNDGQGSGTWPR